MNALTNELRLSYEANEKITANYEEKIKILNEEFDKSIFFLHNNILMQKLIMKLKVKYMLKKI